ncbi:MAG: hypothetical protein MH132_03820 [Hydrotalea sp.]|nr:hypothetical protein [Hydrotalea sp.]
MGILKRGLWLGLLQLMVIYTAMYLFFYEAPYFADIPRKLRHLIKFSSLIGVYLLGTYHLRFEKQRWMGALWHIVHISGISFVLSMGAFDWLVHPTSQAVRLLAHQINEFLISPVLFVAMGLLEKYLKKK